MRLSRFWSGAETLLFLTLALIVCGAELLTRLPSARAGVPRPVVIGAASPTPAVQATIYSADFYCAPCNRYVLEVERDMPPDGWIVCRPGDRRIHEAHIVFAKRVDPADKINAYPTTILRKHGVEVDRLIGRQSPTVLANALNAASK